MNQKNAEGESLKRSRRGGKYDLVKRKRQRMISSSNSDSGFSSMSNSSHCHCQKNDWPSLVMLTKPDEMVVNGRNRIRFPDPVLDRSILLACFDADKKMRKLRHCTKIDTINMNSSIYKKRNADVLNRLQTDEECVYFISIDSIYVQDGDGELKSINNSKNNKKIILADVREHSVAEQCLPEGVSGYWVRIFGEKMKYTLNISLWKNLCECKNTERLCRPLKRKHAVGEDLLKIGELSVDLLNTGNDQKVKKRKRKKKTGVALQNKTGVILQNKLLGKKLVGVDHTPLFCSKERYLQISTCLRECVENGNFELFEEMFSKFDDELIGTERNDVELKQFLNCERSQLNAVQGNFVVARGLLQNVTENVVPKSPNKIFLLNRAYLFLARTHVMEGNYGTAEECLNVLQIDKKNGIPHEDVGYFHLIYGNIMMNFANKLPGLSKNLWKESEQLLTTSIDSFEKVPSLFNALCKARLSLVRLHIFKARMNHNCAENLEKAEEGIINFEDFERRKFSKHIQCLLSVVKSELLYVQSEDGNKLLDDAQEMAKKFNFHEENILCENVRRWCTEKQYEQFMHCLRQNNSEADNAEQKFNSDEYFADQSVE